ncbi:ABC transporter permease subunit [Oceanobacillus jeddahense]|uniref:ABC transporter permease subunit n=1 Tax=Oceanobacillus jeddahense TaxID=1462527 RepID=UPI0036396509
MLAMVRKELKDNRRSLFIWIGAMLGIIAIGAAEYHAVMEAGDEIMELFESLPHVLAIVFGAETIPVHTPLGYYIMMYLWYSVIAFTHAAMLGATIISKEERNRTAEFIFTKPFTRKDIITSKMIAAIINVVIITLTAVIGNLIMLAPQIEGANILSEMTTTMLSMFFIQILFLFTGFLCSAIFSNYKKSLSVSALLVALSYFVMVIVELIGKIDYLGFLTPFMYFKGPAVVENGISLFYLLLTIVITVTACYFTYFKFRSRDLHS